MVETRTRDAHDALGKTICVFTGTRAEYGILKPLMDAIEASDSLSLRLLVTGGHLAASQGATAKSIHADGFEIDEAVEILMDADSPSAVATATGLGTMRYAESLQRLKPQALVILGDRFEALAAATAAAICGVPVVHLHGGEVTLGAVDELFRHAITKLSRLHFTSTEAYRRRVIQLGEEPGTVFNAGALGVANVRSVEELPREEVLRRLDLPAGSRYLLVTFHPATGERESPIDQVEELFSALERFDDLYIVLTGANADLGGRSLNDRIRDWIAEKPDRRRFFQSLGLLLYLSSARNAAAVVGNSSSGIIEVPSLGVPTVDIGSRQGGRERGESVLSVTCDREAIADAVSRAISDDFRRLASAADNPYEKPNTVGIIIEALESTDFARLPPKVFYDLPQERSHD